MKNWIMAIRPKTLGAAFVPVVVATGLVHLNGFEVQWGVSLLALLASLSLQIATNFFNDAIDFRKGADSETRKGPQRVTQSGVLSSQQVMKAGYFCLFLAFIFGCPLVYWGGLPILIVGVVSLFLGYAYTGGPYPLAYKGLGDLFVYLFFGLVAVGGIYFIQTRQVDWDVFIAGSQVGFTATVLIAINNLRDREEDAKVNKRTLSVLIGEWWSKVEIILLYALALCFQIYWFDKLGFQSILPLLIFPLVIRLSLTLWKEKPSSLYNSFLAQSGVLHILFGLLLGVSFCL